MQAMSEQRPHLGHFPMSEVMEQIDEASLLRDHPTEPSQGTDHLPVERLQLAQGESRPPAERIHCRHGARGAHARFQAAGDQGAAEVEGLRSRPGAPSERCDHNHEGEAAPPSLVASSDHSQSSRWDGFRPSWVPIRRQCTDPPLRWQPGGAVAGAPVRPRTANRSSRQAHVPVTVWRRLRRQRSNSRRA
jgi:hypothetical protein